MAAAAVKTNVKEQSDSISSSQSTDVQSYLISNYRDALKKGDKSAAKSCLLAARYFSVNDPNVTNEIYIMAKSDGDVCEASKCFANIFNDLFLCQGVEKSSSNELQVVVNHIKEETRILLGELKSFYLKLKSMPVPANFASRQATSTNPSPMLSPRMRMSSEDRLANRESVAKLDKHLHSSTRGFFYQQLFDNLSEAIKKSILDHSIETCDNPFEKCRLMMLNLCIFKENVTIYGTRLIKSLIELCDGQKDQAETDKGLLNSQPTIMCQYAKSLLVLDAIPQVLNLCSLSELNLDINELFERTLNFYSEHCLEISSHEHDINELHDGVKKSIATRILGTNTYSATEEVIEENLVHTLNLLGRKFVESFDESETRTSLERLHSIVIDKDNQLNKTDSIIEIIKSLGLEDLPLDNADKAKVKEDTPMLTSPPKARGRPKKLQQPAPEEACKKTSNRSAEVYFVSYTLIQHMLINCGHYLSSTKSRVILDFANPLADRLESELMKGSSSQRTSRSKASTQNSSEVSPPAKRIKLNDVDSLQTSVVAEEESPLNSEASKMLDLQILLTLVEAHKCLKFLNSNHGPITKAWQKFLSVDSKTAKLNWFRRFTVDGLLVAGEYDEAAKFIELTLKVSAEDIGVRKEQIESGVSTLTVTSGASVSVSELRRLVQLISCHIHRSDKQDTLTRINELVSKIKQCGLLNNDDGYSSGNLIYEHMVTVQYEDHDSLGFLFFDPLSIMRYCVGTLFDISRRYLNSGSSVTDLAVGHCIVLSHFDWPKNGAIYDQCIAWLRTHKPKSTTPQCLSAATKFTYPEFFNYVRNPNMIEDFMALLRQGYTLDIRGSAGSSSQAPDSQARVGNSSSQTSGSRSASSGTTSRSKVITTRGVNKTFKEDLKVALITQMRNSTFIMPLELISQFIESTLIPYLGSLKR